MQTNHVNLITYGIEVDYFNEEVFMSVSNMTAEEAEVLEYKFNKLRSNENIRIGIFKLHPSDATISDFEKLLKHFKEHSFIAYRRNQEVVPFFNI